MNANEVTEWLTYHIKLFPDYGTWWAEHQSDELKQIWLEQCSRFSLQEAKEASKAILDGEFDAEPPPPWEYNRLPVIVRRVVSGIRTARWEAQNRSRRSLEQKEYLQRKEHYRDAERRGEAPLTVSFCSQQELNKAIERKRSDFEFQSEKRRVAMKNILAWGLPRGAGYVKRYEWALTDADFRLIDSQTGG